MKEVAILGGFDGYLLFPYKDHEKTDIWGLNDFALRLNRCDRIFELHTPAVIKDNHRNPNYYKNLQDTKIPIYMQKQYKAFPKAVKYPYLDIVEKYGRRFYSTVDYMLALAIDECYDKIYLYGVDLAIYEEYLYQRPSCTYWIGLARGRGIDVFIQEGSGINFSGAYAYENSKEQALVRILEEVYGTKNKIKSIDLDIGFTDGVLVAIDNLRQTPDLNLSLAITSGNKAKMNALAEKVKLEKELEMLLLKVSEVTGHSVIIPEREIEIKK